LHIEQSECSTGSSVARNSFLVGRAIFAQVEGVLMSLQKSGRGGKF
jgi:hypothetical protein